MEVKAEVDVVEHLKAEELYGGFVEPEQAGIANGILKMRDLMSFSLFGLFSAYRG